MAPREATGTFPDQFLTFNSDDDDDDDDDDEIDADYSHFIFDDSDGNGDGNGDGDGDGDCTHACLVPMPDTKSNGTIYGDTHLAASCHHAKE
jgi:hypothetical protein